jgi:hypothetical protein
MAKKEEPDKNKSHEIDPGWHAPRSWAEETLPDDKVLLDRIREICLQRNIRDRTARQAMNDISHALRITMEETVQYAKKMGRRVVEKGGRFYLADE